MNDKAALRKSLRALRKKHVTTIPDSMRALLFKQPPGVLLNIIPDQAIIGLYYANEYEAPAAGYAKSLSEKGHRIALPRFASSSAPMHFAEHSDPFGETDLEDGAFGIRQPGPDASTVRPSVLFVPLLGFTEQGDRLGQGGGHYDRWLAEHPGTVAIGMAWDCQLLDIIPTEPHDQRLTAIVTPTRLYGPF